MTTATVSTGLRLAVEGMTCASCAGRVERALKQLPGVEDAAVNLATEIAEVRGAALPAAAEIVRAIEAAGYRVGAGEAELAAPAPAQGRPALAREARHLLVAALLTAPLVLPMVGMLFGRHWMLPG